MHYTNGHCRHCYLGKSCLVLRSLEIDRSSILLPRASGSETPFSLPVTLAWLVNSFELCSFYKFCVYAACAIHLEILSLVIICIKPVSVKRLAFQSSARIECGEVFISSIRWDWFVFYENAQVLNLLAVPLSAVPVLSTRYLQAWFSVFLKEYLQG